MVLAVVNAGSVVKKPNSTETTCSQTPTDNHDDGNLFAPRRRWLIAVFVSFGGFNSNLSSQLVSPAVPEIATAFQTTGTVINTNTAVYMLFMGLGTLFWGPMTEIFGRRWIGVISAIIFLACSIGTALSPNIEAFFVFRAASAFMGTAYQVIGPACITDMYHQTERGTVLGWFLFGTLIAPSLGPFLAGVIVAFADWRALFWLQSALVGLSCILAILILPETSRNQRIKEIQALSVTKRWLTLIRWINPYQVLAYFRFLHILLLGLATSSLVWNMQTLLTPVRYVINPRFQLTSPLQSGLFYLAPGAGYMVGAVIGGPWMDRTVKVWMEKRGQWIPEDRLRSSFVAMGIGIPSSIIIYGWVIDQERGGMALPIVCMFTQGVAQMLCMPCLNTYCLEVIEGRGSEVMAGNLFIRYAVSAIGTAMCLPAINSVGVGWMNTISALFVAMSTVGMLYVFYSRTKSREVAGLV